MARGVKYLVTTVEGKGVVSFVVGWGITEALCRRFGYGRGATINVSRYRTVRLRNNVMVGLNIMIVD